jgi:acetyl esterase/lipase
MNALPVSWTLITAFCLCFPCLGSAQDRPQPAQAAQRFFKTNDLNKDGKLSKDEFPERLQGLFAEIDTNKDGVLTIEEDTAFRQKRSNRPNRPQQRPAPLPEGAKVLRDLVYATVGDRRLLLDLYLPPAADQPLPVVVWIHGGGWRAGSKGSAGPARPMVGRGYAVVDVAYRLTGEAKHPAQIQDCKAAIRWIRANAGKHGLDPDRIGAWGSSAGGHLVALLGTSGGVEAFETDAHAEFSSRVQAVVDWFGPTDLLLMNTQAVPGATMDHDAPDSPESLLLGGPLQDKAQRAAAMQVSPITHVSKDDPPILILHGDRDLLVSHKQSEILHAALKKAGVDSTLQIIKGGGHGFRGGDIPRDQITAAAFEFLDKHLKAKESAP